MCLACQGDALPQSYIVRPRLLVCVYVCVCFIYFRGILFVFGSLSCDFFVLKTLEMKKKSEFLVPT